MFLIFIDIHKNILSAQCAIVYSSFEETFKERNNFEVLLEKSVISLFLVKEPVCRIMNLTLPDDLFDIYSISSASSENIYKNEEKKFVKLTVPFTEQSKNSSEVLFQVDFRLQIVNESFINQYITTDLIRLKFKNFVKNICKSSELYKIICTNCGVSLNEILVSFQFIKEFHEGASELAETWFCHKHDHHQIQQPISDTLYIGDLYFYMHTSVIKCLFLSESEKEYKCKKCSSVLSLKKKMNDSTYCGFFCDKVMFQKEGKDLCNIEIYKNDIVVLSLSNIIEENIQSALSCKIYLQSKIDDKTECLLLWINGQKVLQFFMLKEDNANIPSNTEFQLKEVYKLLYSDCSPDSEVAKRWKHDFNVDFFQVSDNTMKVVKKFLGRTSIYNCHDQKLINGFKIGYFPGYPSAL